MSRVQSMSRTIVQQEKMSACWHVRVRMRMSERGRHLMAGAKEREASRVFGVAGDEARYPAILGTVTAVHGSCVTGRHIGCRAELDGDRPFHQDLLSEHASKPESRRPRQRANSSKQALGT